MWKINKNFLKQSRLTLLQSRKFIICDYRYTSVFVKIHQRSLIRHSAGKTISGLNIVDVYLCIPGHLPDQVQATLKDKKLRKEKTTMSTKLWLSLMTNGLGLLTDKHIQLLNKCSKKPWLQDQIFTLRTKEFESIQLLLPSKDML